jgi:hypothetical protein
MQAARCTFAVYLSLPVVMADAYIACWLNPDGVWGCGHRHLTLGAAEKCIPDDTAGFVRAVADDGSFRTLTDDEIGLYRLVLKRKYNPESD